MRRRFALSLAILVGVASLPGQAQELRVAIGEREVARAVVDNDQGYPALPITLLESLGIRVENGPDAVELRLFNDTLRFFPGYAGFEVNLQMESLQARAHEHYGTLFVAQWFFTSWLPGRYPGRFSYRDRVLTLAGDGTPPPTPRRPAADPRPVTVAQQSHRTTARAPTAGPEDTARVPVRRPILPGDPEDLPGDLLGFINASVSGVYDSNIDHRTAATRSYGTVGRLGAGIQSGPVRPFLMARYDFALYRFANSDQWNRTTHDVTVDVAPSLGPLRFRLGGAVRLGSWTEDRQPANQIIVHPQIEYRPTPIHVITLYGLQSARRIDLGTTTLRDTFRVAGLGYYLWWQGGGLLLDGHHESDKSEYVPGSYNGWTGYLWTRIPFTETLRLTLETAYNRRRYGHAFVDQAGTVVRRDWRWTGSTSLTGLLNPPWWEVSLVYTYEINRSNSPYAVYRAHRIETMVRRRW